MLFHSQYKDLKQEGYNNKQIASFMKISIRSLYYYKKNAYEPKLTAPRFKKTYVRVIRYERKEKIRAEKKRLKEKFFNKYVRDYGLYYCHILFENVFVCYQDFLNYEISFGEALVKKE